VYIIDLHAIRDLFTCFQIGFLSVGWAGYYTIYQTDGRVFWVLLLGARQKDLCTASCQRRPLTTVNRYIGSPVSDLLD
jgi:hypothetical protein